jgi:aarF domain-containing kinase
MCANNIGNAFPPVWIDTMSILQDQVPAQPYSVIKEIVESELPFDETFQSFDPEPIGAASIGQVHRAVLKDGTRVVVKVCYPNVERLLKGDVRTMKMFAKIAQPVHVPGLEEIEKQFQSEFDYRTEAYHLERVKENLRKAGLMGPNKICQVPKAYTKLCTKRVLVMEELFGDKLVVELRNDVAHHAERAGQTVEEFTAALKSKEAEFEEKGQEMKGPSAREYDMYASMLNGQRRLHNAWNLVYNSTLGWVTPSRPYQDKSALPINHAKLVDDLIYIHGHEVLIDGLFNGDPHPGNILLLRTQDGSPQLGLIDYGQVKELSKEMRHLFARIIIALDDENKEEVVKFLKQAGYRSERMDPDNMYRYAKVGYDQDNKELTNGR